MKELLSIFDKKDCQFCGESINYNATYCNCCKRDQINPALVLEQYTKSQIARYGIIVAFVAIPVLVFMCYMGLWGITFVTLVYGVILLGAGMYYWLSIAFITYVMPEVVLSHKVPYTKQRLLASRRALVRNFVVYGVVVSCLVYFQVALAHNRPSTSEFKKYLKDE